MGDRNLEDVLDEHLEDCTGFRTEVRDALNRGSASFEKNASAITTLQDGQSALREEVKGVKQTLDSVLHGDKESGTIGWADVARAITWVKRILFSIAISVMGGVVYYFIESRYLNEIEESESQSLKEVVQLLQDIKESQSEVPDTATGG